MYMALQNVLWLGDTIEFTQSKGKTVHLLFSYFLPSSFCMTKGIILVLKYRNLKPRNYQTRHVQYLRSVVDKLPPRVVAMTLTIVAVIRCHSVCLQLY